MIAALKDTLLEMAGSKKFLVLLSTVIAWLALKLGWHVDQDAIDRLLVVVSAYLVGQGIADKGKGAAEVAAANDNKPAAPAAKEAA